MKELIEALGIDWKLLLAQTFNFLVVLIILRVFVYDQILKVLKERKKKIEEGIIKSEEAEKRLKEIENLKLEKIKEAEKEAKELFLDSEKKAREVEEQMLLKAKEKESEILAQAEIISQNKIKESESLAYQNLKSLLKASMLQLLKLKPEVIDEVLISEAVESLKKQKNEI
jgi:F-type H+-transporting ATPase subunit b